MIIVENKLEDLQTDSSLKFCRSLVEALLKGLQKRFGKFLKLSRNDLAVISAIIATATHPYFKLRWLQLKPSLNNKENENFAKKVVVNSLETLDQNDSPEESGIALEGRRVGL